MSAPATPRPRPPRLPRRRLPLALALSLAPLVGLPACLCPPSIEDVHALGFRSPEATFRSFQTAVRANSPTLEFRCLSVGFRERNQLSQLSWREFREEWFGANPFLKRGIAKAQLVSSERIGEAHALLVAQAYGRRFELQLAREAFYQLYDEDQLAADDLLPDQRGLSAYLDAEPSANGRVLVIGAVEIDAAELPARLTEYRLGLEWKIDGIRMLDDETDPAKPLPQS